MSGVVGFDRNDTDNRGSRNKGTIYNFVEGASRQVGCYGLKNGVVRVATFDQNDLRRNHTDYQFGKSTTCECKRPIGDTRVVVPSTGEKLENCLLTFLIWLRSQISQTPSLLQLCFCESWCFSRDPAPHFVTCKSSPRLSCFTRFRRVFLALVISSHPVPGRFLSSSKKDIIQHFQTLKLILLQTHNPTDLSAMNTTYQSWHC